MIIAKQHLVAKKACQDQVDLFVETFGEEFEITLDNCLKAVAVGLDLGWAAYNLFTSEQYETYEITRDQLWETYNKAHAQLLAAYETACAPLWGAYMEACAKLSEEYEKGCAKAFYEATLI